MKVLFVFLKRNLRREIFSSSTSRAVSSQCCHYTSPRESGQRQSLSPARTSLSSFPGTAMVSRAANVTAKREGSKRGPQVTEYQDIPGFKIAAFTSWAIRRYYTEHSNTTSHQGNTFLPDIFVQSLRFCFLTILS